MESLDEKITDFLQVGYGRGSGDGSVYGCGSGYGYGSGDGYGCGSGDGYGYGSGCGSGFGEGSGDVYAYGCGYGFGYGGWKAINGKPIHYIDDMPTVIESVHGNYAKGYIVGKDMVLKPTFVAKSGDYFAHGETLKQAVADAENKRIKDMPIEDKIAVFNKTYPSNDEEILGRCLFDYHGILTCSCLQGRLSFIEGRYSLAKYYTVPQFVEICKDAYGGSIIRQLAESRGIEC